MKRLIATMFVLSSMFSFGQAISLSTTEGKVYFDYVDEKTKGSIEGVETKLMIDKDNPGSSYMFGSVKVETLTTNNKTRDKHLKSADFFDAAKFPTMTFQLKEVVEKEGKHYAKGELTIKDVKKEVRFRIVEGEDSLTFKTTIYSSDYGIAVKKGREKSKVHVSVKLPLN